MAKWGLRATIVASSAGVLVLAQACSDGNNTTPDASTDASQDVTNTPDSSVNDSGNTDSGNTDSGGGDASDGGCPGSWTAAPTNVPTPLIIPDGGGTVVLIHAAATGTQDYTCEQTDASAYSWVFVGPEADLHDCNANVIGHHFASDGGPTAPEWMTIDNSYVIGAKNVGYTPDGGASSVAWLLLHATDAGGTGTIASTHWIHRLNTDGGITPATTCDSNNAGNTEKVGYSADYYFYGP